MTSKTLFITGANRGIGLALAGHLLRAGHTVIGGCRNPDGAEELRALGVPVIRLDVGSDEDLAQVVPRLRQHVDHLDVLVNNAGVKWAAGREWEPSSGPIEVLDRAAVLEVVSTNLVGALMTTKAVLPVLRQPGGVVASISSQLSSFGIGLGVDYAYNCSKAALNMMTVTMDRDIGRLGVSAVSVNPGWMRTEMGGAEAPLDVEEATGHIASLLVRLDLSHAGRFVDRFGEPVPW